MTIKDLNPQVSEYIANVRIKPGKIADIAILESDDRGALMTAVCIALSHSEVEFVSGTATTATLSWKGFTN